jgi:hypothetical protein
MSFITHFALFPAMFKVPTLFVAPLGGHRFAGCVEFVWHFVDHNDCLIWNASIAPWHFQHFLPTNQHPGMSSLHCSQLLLHIHRVNQGEDGTMAAEKRLKMEIEKLNEFILVSRMASYNFIVF